MFHQLLSRVRKPISRPEGGQGMVEYGLIIALVAIVAIAGLILLGPAIQNLFTGIAASI